MSRNTFAKRPLIALMLAWGVAACATAPNAPSISAENELLQVDAAYDAYNRQNGFAAASEAFIDFESGFLIDGERGFLVGREAIMNDRQLDTVPSPVFWSPDGAMAAASGDFGITWGRFGVEGDPPTAGSYLTVWRQRDGEWKIVTDVAVDDLVPSAPEVD